MNNNIFLQTAAQNQQKDLLPTSAFTFNKSEARTDINDNAKPFSSSTPLLLSKNCLIDTILNNNVTETTPSSLYDNTNKKNTNYKMLSSEPSDYCTFAQNMVLNQHENLQNYLKESNSIFLLDKQQQLLDYFNQATTTVAATATTTTITTAEAVTTTLNNFNVVLPQQQHIIQQQEYQQKLKQKNVSLNKIDLANDSIFTLPPQTTTTFAKNFTPPKADSLITTNSNTNNNDNNSKSLFNWKSYAFNYDKKVQEENLIDKQNNNDLEIIKVINVNTNKNFETDNSCNNNDDSKNKNLLSKRKNKNFFSDVLIQNNTKKFKIVDQFTQSTNENQNNFLPVDNTQNTSFTSIPKSSSPQLKNLKQKKNLEVLQIVNQQPITLLLNEKNIYNMAKNSENEDDPIDVTDDVISGNSRLQRKACVDFYR